MKPIIFSAPMVNAILAGNKTQTRRVVSERHLSQIDTSKLPQRASWSKPDPFGKPGDRLWVRETSSAGYKGNGADEGLHRCVGYYADEGLETVFIDESDQAAVAAWEKMHRYRGDNCATVPAIHMPRWACRLVLEITDVRIERLQSISEADAVAEGMPALNRMASECYGRRLFRDTWQSIHGPGSWELNPYVWALTFRRLSNEGPEK